MKLKFGIDKEEDNLEEIEEIYKDEEGNPVDMTKIEKGSRTKHVMIWLAGIAVLLIIAGVAGWFVFNRPTEDGGDVIVTMEAPAEIASGDTVDIEVTVENKEYAGWAAASVSMRFPDGFYISDANPEPTEGRENTWDLGTVAANTSKTIHIRGQLVGAVDDEREFYTVLTYEPENFKYEFQKTASAKTKITSSTIEADITAPARATNQDEIEYKVLLTQNSDAVIGKAQATIEVPTNFDLVSETPETENELQWEITDWDKNTAWELSLTGILNEQDGDTQQFGLRVNIINDDGTESRQVESFTIIQVVNPELDIQAEIDGSTEDALLYAGDEKTLELRLQNNSDLVMRDIQIEVDTEPEDLTGSVSLFEEAFPITYTSAEYLELEELKPNEDATFEIPFHVLGRLTGENIEASFNISVKQAEIDGTVVEEGLAKTKIDVKVPTELDLSVYARYYSDFDGEIGSGPLPPVAGETTEYAVFWTLENTHNQASDITVTAEFPENVEFGEERRVDSGSLTYDSATRTLTWKIQKIPANTEIDAYFSVRATPEDSDVGTLLVLTQVAELKGFDIWAVRDLTDTEEGITAELLGDPVAEGDGIVTN